MSLKATLKADRMKAMKSGNSLGKDVINNVLSNMDFNEKKQLKAGQEFNETQVLNAVIGEYKTRRASAELYAKIGETARAEREAAEADFLEQYIPVEISDEELKALVLEVIEANPGKPAGPLKGMANKAVGQKASGGRISAMVDSLLA